MNTSPRIVFFGTPDFAVASLRALADGGYDIAAVVTAPDKAAGRGLKLTASPVKTFALSRGLPVLQPVNLKDPAFVAELEAFSPDLQIVIAFRMMPRVVWALPRLGTFNLHASLLPQYRGAAPINHVIINGETETGITTFFINERIDTGGILLARRIPVGPDETAGELHDRLMIAGAALVISTVEGIAAGTLREKPQEELIPGDQPLREAPKIFRENCRINWDEDVEVIHNLIRGLSPYPAAFTEKPASGDGLHLIKIFRASFEHSQHGVLPGTFLTDGKNQLRVAGKNGFIQVLRLQVAGRSVMDTPEFLRGFGWMVS